MSLVLFWKLFSRFLCLLFWLFIFFFCSWHWQIVIMALSILIQMKYSSFFYFPDDSSWTCSSQEFLARILGRSPWILPCRLYLEGYSVYLCSSSINRSGSCLCSPPGSYYFPLTTRLQCIGKQFKTVCSLLPTQTSF